jgi:hypothetical protein
VPIDITGCNSFLDGEENMGMVPNVGPPSVYGSQFILMNNEEESRMRGIKNRFDESQLLS